MARSESPDEQDGELFHSIAALERTALAWERTAISLAALGAMLFKLVGDGPVIRSVGIAMVAAALVVILVMVPLGYRRAREDLDPEVLESRFDSADRLRHRVMLGTALLVTLTAVGVTGELVWTKVLTGWTGP